MSDWVKRLSDSAARSYGDCWNWDPWVVWSHGGANAVMAICCVIIAGTFIHVVRRREDALFDGVVALVAALVLACGCTCALEVYNIWHGAHRLAGLVKVITAEVSLLATFCFLRFVPKLRIVPTLNHALAMDAALSSEKQEKQRMEGQLRGTLDRFRLLVEGVKDYALILLDPDGRVTSWNPGAERITGYSQTEIMGEPFSRLFPAEEQEAGMPAAMLRQAAAEGRLEYEGQRIRKDGTAFLINEVITPFYDSDGALRGFAKVARDITEQRSTQAALQRLAENLEDQVRARVQELRESEVRLQGFIRHASAAIAFKGLDGRFLLINPRMEALIGRPAQEILGRTNADLFPVDSCARAFQADQRVLVHREEVQVEEALPREDGSTRYLLVHKFPLVDTAGVFWGMGIISTDITERKRADLALLQSQKLESLGVLAGGIAHDFNNLLGAMAGNVELAMAETSLARVTPYLETLTGLMAKASELLRQMLAYAGKGNSSVRILDLNHLVEEMTRLLETSVSKKAAISLELHPEPLAMAADPAQIQQVVMNLIINASEAMGEQSGVITIRTGLEDLGPECLHQAAEGLLAGAGPHVFLQVSDNGAGMQPEVMKKIFDPFFTTKFAGRGLGLAAIHGIVRGLHGAIQVVSEPGQGSTFKLLFPAAPGAAHPSVSEPTLAQLPLGRDDGEGAVLVVDDEEAMRRVAVLALERMGIRTFQARDGRDALAVFQANRQQVRLILMDLTMPNMDGEEACRELRRRGFAVPVILCSGFSEPEAVSRFQGLELAGFIQKPFGLGALVERVRKVLSPASPRTG